MTAPNILFLVWDACRFDMAKRHASTLTTLAEENLWFERAITPAGWSLPAHASLLTGENPHTHGIYRIDDQVESLPLLDRLANKGYTRHCLSANGFLSPTYQFTCGFDEYQGTHEAIAFLDGLDVAKYLTSQSENDESSINPVTLLSAILTHDSPFQSIGNAAAVGMSHLSQQYPSLQRIPHRRFSKHGGFCYDPVQNTKAITSRIKSAADCEDPFFIFANYMDTHWPYNPPSQYQRKYLNESYSKEELTNINDRAHAYHYAERIADEDNIRSSNIETIRHLYRGEVRSVDDHFRQIIQTLKRQEFYENTIIIVTADHGENLGASDRRGERWMGHESSASDALLHVPLVVAHPRLNGQRINEWVSAKDILPLLANFCSEFLTSSGVERGPLASSSMGVISEYPADGRASGLKRTISSNSRRIPHPDPNYRLLRSMESRRFINGTTRCLEKQRRATI